MVAIPLAHSLGHRKALRLAACVCLAAACANCATPQWRPVGPAPQITHGVAISGRVDSIAWSPNWNGSGNPALYIGTSSGGIWRSKDYLASTPHWEPISDSIKFPITRRPQKLEPTALTVNPFRPQELYSSTPRAQGVLVSADGGDHWHLTGHAYFLDKTPIDQLLVDPTDPTGNTWFAVTLPRGATLTEPESPVPTTIHRTGTSGQDWELRVSGLATGRVSDLVATRTPNGELRLIAAVATKGIWFSDDGGLGWTAMPMELRRRATGLPASAASVGRIRLAVDPGAGWPLGAYAAITDLDDPDEVLLNVFRLEGDIWKPTGQELPSTVSTQGGNTIALGLSPVGTVYLGTQFSEREVFASNDRGATWVPIGAGTNGVTPHRDFHVWGFASGAVFAGNDGGIWRYLPALDPATAGSWMSLNTEGLQTIQSNGVGADPADRNVMIEGSQDNGLARRQGAVWTWVFGGDSGPGRYEADPAQGSQFAYHVDTPEAGETYFFGSTDGGASWGATRPPDFHVPDLPDYAPYAVHPSEPGRLIIGLDRVYELRGRTNWFPVSPALEQSVQITSLAYGAAPGAIIVAYRNGHVWLTKDGGGDGEDPNHWRRIDQGTAWGIPAAVLADFLFPQEYFLLSRGGGVWRTATDGAIWEEVTGAFPRGVGIASGLRPSWTSASGGALFLGTSIGVYVSRYQSAATCWTPYLTGLPDVRVTDLQEHAKTDHVIAATYGRGIYEAPLEAVVEPSLKLDYQSLAGCRPTAVTDAKLHVSDKLVGLTGASVAWSIDSGAIEPAARGSGAVMTLPGSPGTVRVTATATADACALTESIDVVVVTPEQADRIERICSTLKDRPRKLPNWLVDPLWDPLRVEPIANPIGPHANGH